MLHGFGLAALLTEVIERTRSGTRALTYEMKSNWRHLGAEELCKICAIAKSKVED